MIGEFMRAIPVRVFISFFVVSSIMAQSTATGRKSMLGFSEQGASSQSVLEARFDESLNSANLVSWLKRLSARPHHLGSPYNKENADFIAAQFRSWGYDTKLEEFQVLFPTPKTRIVEMTMPEKFTLKLQEPPVEGDATSGQLSEQLPTYNSYSIDGDVTEPLVYANY